MTDYETTQTLVYSPAALRQLLAEHYDEDAPAAAAQVNRWLDRGDGVAVYTNEDFGHPDFGQIQIVSYGSGVAQLEVEVPPERLPDIGNTINWRYNLTGVYRGAEL